MMRMSNEECLRAFGLILSFSATADMMHERLDGPVVGGGHVHAARVDFSRLS